MSFATELRHSARRLRRSPGFTAVAIATLALGIGATAAIFSVIRGVLLEPLPFPAPDRLVQLWQVGEDGQEMQWSEPNFRDVRDQARTLDVMAAYHAVTVTVTGGGEASRISGAAVSDGFFPALGVQPVRGRTLIPEDHRDDAAVAVVSGAYWRGSLGGDPNVLGRSLRIEERAYTVVGIVPTREAFPAGADIWIPRETDPEASRTAHNWRVLGRLSNDATLSQARQELAGIAIRLKQQYGDDTWMSNAAVVPLREELVGTVRPALLVLLGGAALLLLIACANVANLLLTRATARSREIAVRMALGAGRARVFSQLLTESTLVAVAAAVLGVVLALWGVDALLALAPARLPRLDTVGVDWAVLAFTLGVALLAGGAIGFLAALRATTSDVHAALEEGGRTETGGAMGRVRSALVATQVALTMVLLVGAGLLGRSFIRLITLDPGYRTDGALVMDVTLPMPEGESDDPLVLGTPNARGGAILAELVERVSALPGVTAAGGINALPLTGGGANGMFLVLQRPDEVRGLDDWTRLSALPGRAGESEYRLVTRGYFAAMGIPLLRGRLFDERDAPGAAHVALVSASFAERQWHGEDPLGRLIQFGNMDGDLHAFTVVGVVGDVRDRSIEAPPQPTLYASALQRTTRLGGAFDIVVRGTVAPTATIPAARRIARELTPDGPVQFRSLDEVHAASLGERRFGLFLLGVFGVTALVLAALGIYGVIAFVVTQRTREIGIRVALGAQRGSVVRLVVQQALVLTAVGVVTGAAISGAATRLLRNQLYGVGALDPVTFFAVTLVLTTAALAASYIPARRATAVNPVNALRQE